MLKITQVKSRINRKKDHKATLVSEYIDGFIEDLIISDNAPESIPDPVYREHLQEIQNVCYKFLLKYISSCQENWLAFHSKEHSECIHEGVLMIGRKDERAFRINIIAAQYNYFPVEHIVMPESADFFQQSIAA